MTLRAVFKALGLVSFLAFLLAAFPASATPDFKRGINLARLHNLPARDRDNPGKYLWPPFRAPLSQITDAELKRLRALGFDFVRLPVTPAPFLTVDDAKRRILMEAVMETIGRIRAVGLGVLVDPHPKHGKADWTAESILSSTDGDQFAGYKAWLMELAQRLARLDDRQLALGLMNEPQTSCRTESGIDWTEIQPLLYSAVRAVAPDITLVLTGGCWSGLRGLQYLDVSDFDANTLIDFHYYSPYYFTHQGLSFASEPVRYLSGLSYPAEDGDPAVAIGLSRELIASRRERYGDRIAEDAPQQAIKGIARYYRSNPSVTRDFRIPRDWSRSQGVDPARMLLGEFGAARAASGMPENPSRYVWLEDVRRNAEAAGFAWAMWDYNAGDGYPGFGLVLDNDTREIDERAVEALGLDPGAVGAWPLRGPLDTIR